MMQSGGQGGNGRGNGRGNGSATDPTRDAVARLRQLGTKLTEAGLELARTDPVRIARSLGEVAQRLAHPDGELGREARRVLPPSTGLSPEMVDWALRTNVAPTDARALERLSALLRPPLAERSLASRPRLVVVWLAGNVFTAPLRALFLPLLAGSPVIAKASSRDDVFPRLLEHALGVVDPRLAGALAVITFPGGSTSLEDALIAQADVVSAYGSDATLAQVRARTPGTTRFIPHGHGLGVAYVGSEAVAQEETARKCIEAVALDVAAFDQRGCLSPHVVYVERGAHLGGQAFAERLAREGLAPLARSLPRGPLPTIAGAGQVQWRGVAAARGELYEGDGFATSFEGEAALRVSPGWRNVAVLECEDAADLGRRLAPLGTHLKAVGVAGSPALRRRIAESLPPPLAPRISEVGTMQTPPVDALADGDTPWLGLRRWIEIG